jgi:predicted peroxiredoxin
MKLGILINTDRHLAHVTGITHAALDKGHEVIIFVMDDGTKLLNAPAMQELCRLTGVATSFCSFNARQRDIGDEGLSQEIAAGSQLNNVAMNRIADKVIVL